MIQLNINLQRKFDLLYLLTHKEVALKYKRTMLGIFWSMLNPILLALVFFVAFKIFMRFNVENYTFFLLSALFPWTWFQSSILLSSRTFIENVNLIKKIIFPRHYLVVAIIFSQLVHLVFSLPILLFFSFKDMQGPSLAWIWGIPLLILIQFMFTFGLSVVVAILNTYFRDMEYLVGVAMTLIFWLTPITYPLSAIPQKYQSFFLFNPLASLIFSWRELLIYNRVAWSHIGSALGFALLVFFFGKKLFHHLERRLDEVL